MKKEKEKERRRKGNENKRDVGSDFPWKTKEKETIAVVHRVLLESSYCVLFSARDYAQLLATSTTQTYGKQLRISSVSVFKSPSPPSFVSSLSFRVSPRLDYFSEVRVTWRIYNRKKKCLISTIVR